MPVEITAQDVKKKLENNEDFFLLDVRRDREFDFNKIEGAIHVALDKLGEGSLTVDKNTEIVTYCHHGVRSMKAAHILVELGFENVKSMAGGIHEWSLSVDSSVPTY